MPKSQTIVPDEVRKPSKVELKPIPVNQYDRTVKDELSNYGKDALVRIYRDMVIIRTFENMLNEIKLRGSYEGIEYTHKGPAHLSIGQEAAAVGQALNLDIEDHIYGSHRSHGEILAKGLSAIEKLPDEKLTNIMENYFEGDCLKVVSNDAAGSTKDLAIDYLIYGALAEIFGREAGFNKGMGGSMHAFFPPFGIYPNNAIVGGSADIALGAALYKKINKKPGMVIANIGDGSSSCGPTWESICMATMDQYTKLWDEAHRGGVPLIYNFVDNFYAMGGQPAGETMGFEILARIGAGVNADQMHAERVDGYNPLAVADAITRKKNIIADGRGPVLLDVITYRFSGHSPSDASSYREKEEIEAWQQCDPLNEYSEKLIDAGVCSAEDVEAINEKARGLIFKAYKKAIDLEISPRPNLYSSNCLLDKVTFSDQKVDSMDPDRQCEVLAVGEDNPRLKSLARRSRGAFDENGEQLPKSRCIGIRDALFEAILDMFRTDPTLVAYGEENRDWGGAFAVYRGLTEALPYHRLFNTPITEGAIVGSAIGYALEGGRALVELMYCDFLGRAGDEVFNQLAKWQAMSGGLLKAPVVLRVSVGNKYGAQHSQDWTSICTHVPGLKVAFPATPYDAKGMMYSALTGTDPVIFFESQRIYDQPEIFVPDGVPEGRYEVPLGEPDVKKTGDDLTILSIGATLYRVMEAVEQLENRYGVSCEVIDARSLVPFNYEKVLESVRKTRKIMLTSDACQRDSFMQHLAADISRFAFDELDAPPTVVGARNWITPADEIEDTFFPYPNDMLDAVHEYIIPLKGYRVQRECDVENMLWRSRKGL